MINNNSLFDLLNSKSTKSGISQQSLYFEHSTLYSSIPAIYLFSFTKNSEQIGGHVVCNSENSYLQRLLTVMCRDYIDHIRHELTFTFFFNGRNTRPIYFY